ncbi:DUF6541 family protein [Geodermatophilus amargosae]|uniref:DUF6541 family protein n=1 Tax=Geodermatophilus amargosae TaxID=1296565 RepID=UPI0034DFEFC7
MTWHDALRLLLALAAVLGPGAALLAVGLRRGPLETLAAGPAASVLLCYVTALLAAPLGIPWGPLPVVVVTLVATAVAWLLRRRAVAAREVAARVAVPLWARVLPVAGVVVSAAVGGWTFLRGFGTLSVLPQEHDMVLQTLLVGYIERTGNAAPWQSNPVDLLTGEPSGFYPNGLHMLASLAATGPAESVAALNAVSVVLFAVVLPLGMAALAHLLSPPHLRPVAMAAAALTSVLAYRPVFALLHDGGVLANAAALALTPGVVYAAVSAATVHRGAAVAAGAGLVGAVVVHPSAAPTIVLTAGVWVVATLLSRRDGVRAALRSLTWVVVAAVLAVVVLVPFLLTASSTAAFVASFPRQTPPASLGGALGTLASFYYGGYYDPAGMLSQAVLALLSLLGVLLCVFHRSNVALLAAFGTWAVVLLLWLINPATPLVASLGGVYYNTYGRFSGGLAILQWLTVGVAVGYAASYLATGWRWAAGRLRSGRWAHRAGLATPVGAAAALLVFLLVTVDYASVNSLTLRQRYAEPEFVRVDEDDLAAGRWLAENVEPGQRVMNNANDGSTYAYVFSGVPIVETATLGSPYAPYTTDLLLHLDDVDRDDDVRQTVCDLDIAWVLADEEAPVIGAPESVTPLSDGGVYDTPRGFERLDDLEVAERVHTSGNVDVYRLDLDRLGC